MPGGALPAKRPLDEAVELLCRAVALRQEGRLSEALRCLDEALRLSPALLPCRTARAELLAELDRHEDAVADLAFCISLNASAAGIPERLEVAVDAGLASVPGTSESACLRRGNILSCAKRFPEALIEYRKALDHNPDNAEALNNLGFALVELARPDEALVACRRYVELNPGDAAGWHNLGNVQRQLLCIDAAQDCYQRALAIDPALAEAHVELSHCLLSKSDWAEAWPHYEWRWKTAQLARHRFDSGRAAWAEPSSLAGRSVLVWTEQGYGDTLQFARFLPRLADTARKVVVRAPAVLHELIRGVDARLVTISEDDELPDHDIQCPLLSLPLALGGGRNAPPTHPCLRADPIRTERWRKLLGACGQPRIGIAWRGRREGLVNPTRDVTPEALLPLAELPMQFVSLQNRAEDHEDAALASWTRLRRFPAELRDFSETAALIDNLDLVIAVDTAVAHLAAGLGKPCWLLLRQAGEWRWQLADAAPSPWYPQARIFRQTTAGDWTGPLRNVASALRRDFPPS